MKHILSQFSYQEYIFIGFFLLIIGVMVYKAIMGFKEIFLFKIGHNPYKRICKKCGAVQDNYRSNVEGDDSVWWEVVYAGNDENCDCHRHAEYRNYL